MCVEDLIYQLDHMETQVGNLELIEEIFGSHPFNTPVDLGCECHLELSEVKCALGHGMRLA